MAENKKRIYRSTETTNRVVDTQTGEVLSEHNEQLELGYAEMEPQYIKIYVDCILRFKGISNSFNPILISLCKHTQFADKDQILFVNKYVKELVCNECGIKIKRVEQAIKEFVDCGLLYRKARGVYLVNPYIIGRGRWEDIKRLRATFDFITGEMTVDSNVIEEAAAASEADAGNA